VAWAARMNQTKMPGPILRAVRDLVLPSILRRTARSQAWVFDHRVDWEARVLHLDGGAPSLLLPSLLG